MIGPRRRLDRSQAVRWTSLVLCLALTAATLAGLLAAADEVTALTVTALALAPIASLSSQITQQVWSNANPPRLSALPAPSTTLPSLAIAVSSILHNEREPAIAAAAAVAVARATSRCDAPVYLLVDLPDREHPRPEADQALLDSLRRCFPVASGVDRVRVLVRERRFSPRDRVWMGWERKRGKLLEFMDWTRGRSKAFQDLWGGSPSVIRHDYVLALDQDSRIDDDSVVRLLTVALAVRPDGPAIICPRLENRPPRIVTPFWRLFHPDPARRAGVTTRSFWQDVLHYDHYYGKGLLHIDGFANRTAALPEGVLLSHDHLEGMVAGAALVSEAVCTEEDPGDWKTWRTRQARWIRGDLQLALWAFGLRPIDGVARRAALHRWKLRLNLWGHLAAPGAVAGWVLVAWRAPLLAPVATLFLVVSLRPDLLLAPIARLGETSRGEPSRARPLLQAGFQLMVALDLALTTLWAVSVTALRSITGRGRLQWNLEGSQHRSAIWPLSSGAMASALAAGLLLAMAQMQGRALWIAGPVLALWIVAPAVCSFMGRPR